MGVLILQMWFVRQALALDPQPSSYLRADFTVEQGLPGDKVNAIAQPRMDSFGWERTVQWPGSMEGTSPRFVCVPEFPKKFP